MRFLLLLISFGLLSCKGKEVKNDETISSLSEINMKTDDLKVNNEELRMLLSNYDTSSILISYYFLFNPQEKIFPVYSLPGNFYEPLGVDVMNNKITYVRKIDSILSIKQNQVAVEPLTRWCENEQLLNIVLNSKLNNEAKIYFEQLIWETPDTRHLLKKYLKTDEQYWGSLDIEQSCSLYYDVLLYLQPKSVKYRLAFFKSYLNMSLDEIFKSSSNVID